MQTNQATQITTRCPLETPWGNADHVREVAPGIWSVDTPGHGGYYVALERRKEMPPALAAIRPFAGPGWYEEDCDWAIVAAAFPQHFGASERFFAYETLRGLGYAQRGLKAFLATPEGQEFERAHAQFYADHALHFRLGGMSSSGQGWQVSARSLDGRRRAMWEQPDYPDWRPPFSIEDVTAAGHAVSFEEVG